MPSYSSSTTLAGGVATALTLLGVAIALYLALLAALYVMQRRILFQPNQESPLVELVRSVSTTVRQPVFKIRLGF